ncbi:hypothetical protein QT381_00690 [Galbitalea sp. SE-J8]|uniref:type IV pilus modification PilV family protein n=1 Tax=Galbitalea sp. SE-J8 TaxID=3054952 RepID=UPI00259C97FD|nr:hypothetical protein [Galbitalea sp. SE-J8]MDM4761525.1 hypothetical protein [Galbitalea sp. SE-J8]
MGVVMSGRADVRECGLGIIEVVVAVLLIAIVAVAFLPVLLNGLRMSAVNATMAAGNELANAQLEEARAATTCVELQTWVAAAASVTDARNVELQAYKSYSGCDNTDSDKSTVTIDAYPGAVEATVRVTRADTGAAISTIVTRVYLGSYA